MIFYWMILYFQASILEIERCVIVFISNHSRGVPSPLHC